jgi:hypothetical protein
MRFVWVLFMDGSSCMGFLGIDIVLVIVYCLAGVLTTSFSRTLL